MNVLLFGSAGFIGSQLKDAFLKAGYGVHDPRVEIRDLSAVRRAFEEAKPDVVVNATGITGKPNVDWCEEHPAETYSVNVGGSLNIAQVAQDKDAYMVQMSSGCVYDGTPEGGYTEEDEPDFFGSVYSRSRVMSEAALLEFNGVLQLRVRIPLMGKPHRKNLIDKLLTYPKMINKMNSCTVMEDFIPAVLQLIDRKATGVFNMTNIGAMDHMGIMGLYKEIVDPSFEINVMSPEKEAELCERRSNCILNTDKREALGVHMPPLEESLRRILGEYKKATSAEKGGAAYSTTVKVRPKKRSKSPSSII
jgi:dTDP-4-dehydrorhamnose reductase